MPQAFDLNISHIREQIDIDFPKISNSEDGKTQKNILTWLELRHRLNQREAYQKRVGALSFEQCVEEWSKGGMSYPEILKKARELMGKNTSIENKKIEEVENVFNTIGEKPIEIKRLGTFKNLSNRVIYRFKNIFNSAEKAFKKHREEQVDGNVGFIGKLLKKGRN